jgi:hypothetical protein
VTAGVPEDCLSGVHDCSVNDCKTAVGVLNPQEPQIKCCANLRYGRSNFQRRKLLDIGVLGFTIEAELLQETQLIRNLTDKLKRSKVVDVHLASVGSKKQFVMGSANRSEHGSFFLHRADKLSLLVKDEHLAIFSENKEKVG